MISIEKLTKSLTESQELKAQLSKSQEKDKISVSYQQVVRNFQVISIDFIIFFSFIFILQNLKFIINNLNFLLNKMIIILKFNNKRIKCFNILNV